MCARVIHASASILCITLLSTTGALDFPYLKSAPHRFIHGLIISHHPQLFSFTLQPTFFRDCTPRPILNRRHDRGSVGGHDAWPSNPLGSGFVRCLLCLPEASSLCTDFSSGCQSSQDPISTSIWYYLIPK